MDARVDKMPPPLCRLLMRPLLSWTPWGRRATRTAPSSCSCCVTTSPCGPLTCRWVGRKGRARSCRAGGYVGVVSGSLASALQREHCMYCSLGELVQLVSPTRPPTGTWKGNAAICFTHIPLKSCYCLLQAAEKVGLYCLLLPSGRPVMSRSQPQSPQQPVPSCPPTPCPPLFACAGCGAGA